MIQLQNCTSPVFFKVAKKASVLRRRKSRTKMPVSPTNGADGDFDDNVFEVEEGGRTGEIVARANFWVLV